ncbi:beta-hexosaminidase [Algoriphagus machipongonensis]|uniref:beta-N-acetylhexosaminidase n=2 Tax=Algoriphagus machipongonensis TaxID=388413 RepID=A3HRL7_9BACT|nr:beta-hexosaminidase [Algoriphagus machipongonensis]
MPTEMNVSSGEFKLSSSTQLVFQSSDGFDQELAFFQVLIKSQLGEELTQEAGSTQIEIIKSEQISGQEAYRLSIDKEKIRLEASDSKGIFYGIITLEQLMVSNSEKDQNSGEILIPALEIKDQPNYEWRGMHLDVSRHFFSMDYLKRYVDLLALYKLNKLHLHLTDDQGWRIEIKKYPELTEKGAWREFNEQDSICIERSKEDPRFAIDPAHIYEREGKTIYGGYYSQEELKEFVEFASARHIEIIPEIDMPGHMMAAIDIFPELTCNGESAWGDVFSTPLCPINEEVYTFVENVLAEVIAIFPSKYVHIGADEVDKTDWKKSAAVTQFMQKEGIEDYEALQSYFVKRVTDYLQGQGKEVIVWDDALGGGIPSDLKVMYWRNWVANVPEKTVANGNEIIIAAGNPFYFSTPKTKLYNVYTKELLGSKFPQEKMNLVKGLQASLWTETIPSEELADAKLFPNVLALAERAWSTQTQQDWSSFKKRLKPQLEHLDQLGVKYEFSPSYELVPFMNVDIENKKIGISFETDLIDPVIYYTLDGSIPTTDSNLYEGEFFVEGSASIVAAIFDENGAQEPFLNKEVDFHKAIGKPVLYEKPWNPSYAAGDAGTLTDGYRGGDSYADGYWQGFTSDIEVTVDMEEVTSLSSFSARFMQLKGPGVFLPGSVEVWLSEDGGKFEKVLDLENDVSPSDEGLIIKNFSAALEGKTARFIKVKAENTQSGFMFVDELVIY